MSTYVDNMFWYLKAYYLLYLLIILFVENAPPLRLRYSIETVMDSVGKSTASVTFRGKLGKIVARIKDQVEDKRLCNFLKTAKLDHFLQVEEKHWKSGLGNLLHFFCLGKLSSIRRKSYGSYLGTSRLSLACGSFV